MRHKLLTFFILLWYFCAVSTVIAQGQLPDGVWNELLSANDGKATIEAASDDSVSALFNAMSDFLCSDFQEEGASQCQFQHTQGATEKEITTYAFDHIFRDAHFQAMLSLHPLSNESSYQLWQLYFVHFPERDEMYEIRVYQNPIGRNETVVLWKTEIFLSSYYLYKPLSETIIPDFGISTTSAGIELSIEKPWSHPRVEIFDLTGQLVHRSNGHANFESKRTVMDVRTDIETTGWAPGIYMVRLNEGAHSRTKKFYLVP